MLGDEELRWQLLSSSMMVELLPIVAGAADHACTALARAIRGCGITKPLNVTQACHHRQIGHHAGSPSNIMLSSCLQYGWLQIHAIPVLFCRHSQEKDNLLSHEAHHAAACLSLYCR